MVIGMPKSTAKSREKAAVKAKTSQKQDAGAKDLPKVLVAEDNAVVRKGLENFMKKWGYEPVLAANGDEAWQQLENDHSIRLAILDWNLPGLSGLQVCQRLRTRKHGPYVYTLIFSARTSHEEQILALDGGADDYLAKPAKPSLLRARLNVGHRILKSFALVQKNSQSTPESGGRETGKGTGN